MVLQIEQEKRLSFNRSIKDGDLVIVYERHDVMKAVKVSESGVFHNRFGAFKHSDWIGKPFGSKVFSLKGRFVYLLAPTPELWTLVLSHRTQILYIADISFVVMYLEIVPGCLVLESGTGSGSLTTSLARAVAPTGHVYTFDFHEQRAASAREDFERTGLNGLVTVGVRDIQGEGFPEEFCGRADSVFLDLPQPWLAIPSVGKMLKEDGVICSFSPCIEQVQRSCEALRSCFTDIRTFEVLLRTYEVRQRILESHPSKDGDSVDYQPCKRRLGCEESERIECSASPSVMIRPCTEARGHTGYLTFARLKCVSNSIYKHIVDNVNSSSKQGQVQPKSLSKMNYNMHASIVCKCIKTIKASQENRHAPLPPSTRHFNQFYWMLRRILKQLGGDLCFKASEDVPARGITASWKLRPVGPSREGLDGLNLSTLRLRLRPRLLLSPLHPEALLGLLLRLRPCLSEVCATLSLKFREL
nr:tRNA (adenine(58)-N(1))-methyltransferase catalytic subunit TRMT61A [Ipomoea batatas]